MKKQLLILWAIFLIVGSSNAQSSQSGTNYETGTVIFSTINAALTAMNTSGIYPAWQTEYTQGIGVITGLAQVAYGIYAQAGSGSNKSTLNIINYTVGSAAAITNAIAFFSTLNGGKKKPAPKTEKKTSWNIYYAPINMNNYAIGISLVKHFKI
jgi:hypothetical protein